MDFFAKATGRVSPSVPAILLALATGAASAAPPHYSAMLVEAINTDRSSLYAVAMSDSAMVGYALRNADQENTASFVAVKHGDRTSFRPFAEVSRAVAVSNASDVVGYVVEEDGSTQIYLRTAAGRTTRPLAGFDVANSYPAGVNTSHTIIGAYSTAAGDNVTFSLSNGVLSTLTDLGFGAGVAAINDAGTIAGWALTDAAGTPVAATWKDNTLSLLPNPDPTRDTFATAIASNGLVAGQSNVRGTLEAHAVLWSGDSVIDLGNFGGKLPFARASGVNAAGDVVGYSIGPVADGNGGFVYTQGKMYKLRDITSGLNNSYTIAGATSINDAGQILVVVRDKDGFDANAVLTPDKASN